MSNQTIEWLRGLAAKGSKGAVDNIDARSLGRIADEYGALTNALEELVTAIGIKWDGETPRRRENALSPRIESALIAAKGALGDVQHGNTHD